MASDVCPCHGEPWGKSGNNRVCRIKRRERVRRYLQTEKGKASNRRSAKRYKQTEAGRASSKRRVKKYKTSAKGHITRAAADARYKQKVRARDHAVRMRYAKLLNLSINPSATPAERETARRMAHNLEGRIKRCSKPVTSDNSSRRSRPPLELEARASSLI